MNISSEIFPTDGSDSSDYLFYNGTEVAIVFSMSSLVDIIIVLLSSPIISYVIWLIVTGTGNGLAAEFFILNLSVCEMLLCMESLLSLFIYKVENLWLAKSILNSLGITGRPLFQLLMCVERYLAVVHPVTFLKYKPLRYRVICSVIAWVATFVFSGIGIMFLSPLGFYYFFIMAQFSFYLSIQLFCLVAVLRALKQSGPGERERERKEENHMKRRAFYIILITTVTMLIIYFPFMILMTFSNSIYNVEITFCIGFAVFIFAGSVQPLLFLYRVGKLPFIKSQ